eukprot:CAMPEP_0172864794 /NCGR_PEP_ID=MMETSP1075-20121228/81038_1 /TAXON_ID=2916 /ORGANISM="Ceratium fusus, Strain PA161109" /LENGTH=75 /DNA_ID=CAMNT_0013713751 /DNA_START=138 /DNA_END=365 /DNA_ORIENTATION=-
MIQSCTPPKRAVMLKSFTKKTLWLEPFRGPGKPQDKTPRLSSSVAIVPTPKTITPSNLSGAGAAMSSLLHELSKR